MSPWDQLRRVDSTSCTSSTSVTCLPTAFVVARSLKGTTPPTRHLRLPGGESTTCLVVRRLVPGCSLWPNGSCIADGEAGIVGGAWSREPLRCLAATGSLIRRRWWCSAPNTTRCSRRLPASTCATAEVLSLAAWEGLPHSEIAEVLGCSIAAVDQRLHRAKQRLARHYHAINRTQTLPRAAGGQGS